MRKILTSILFAGLCFPVFSSTNEGYFPFPESGVLPPEVTQFYHQNGYVVLTGYLPQEECDRLYDHAMGIANGLQPTPQDLKEQFDHPTQYLLRSASTQIPFFYSQTYQDGHLILPARDAVYLVGDNTAVCDDEMRKLTLTNLNRTICQSLGYKVPQVNQSQLNFKSSAYSQSFLAHQDQMFSSTLKFPLCTFQIPFVQTTKQNGCLRVRPGSHVLGPQLKYLKVADGVFEYFDMEGNVVPRDQVQLVREEWQVMLDTELPVPAGALILLHGCTKHGSNAGENGFPGRNRVIYTFSLAEQGDQDPRIWNYNPAYPLIQTPESK